VKLDFQYEGEIEEQGSYDRQPLPEGEYHCNVFDSDYKPTKNGNGHYVAVTFEVLDGPHSGRRIFSNYNLDNPNPRAAEIGQQQFARLCLATLGKPSCGDTDDLLGKQCVVGVGFERDDPTRNRVKYTNPTSTSAPMKAAPAADKKPWQKG
jgi:hypothetical protein